MESIKASCKKCNGPLELERAGPYVYLRCKDCSARYPLNKLWEFMDEGLEEKLANIPCDRV